MSSKFNSEAAMSIAVELTKLAIEHGLIIKGTNTEETAKEVTKFLHTVADSLESGE